MIDMRIRNTKEANSKWEDSDHYALEVEIRTVQENYRTAQDAERAEYELNLPEFKGETLLKSYRLSSRDANLIQGFPNQLWLGGEVIQVFN